MIISPLPRIYWHNNGMSWGYQPLPCLIGWLTHCFGILCKWHLMNNVWSVRELVLPVGPIAADSVHQIRCPECFIPLLSAAHSHSWSSRTKQALYSKGESTAIILNVTFTNGWEWVKGAISLSNGAHMWDPSDYSDQTSNHQDKTGYWSSWVLPIEFHELGSLGNYSCQCEDQCYAITILVS